MAKMIGGPFGLISGKLGNRVYYVKDGKQMSRELGQWTKPPTAGQVANRHKMKVAMQFVKTIRVFVDVGFGPEGLKSNRHPMNIAVSEIRKMAIIGDYPDTRINFSKLLISSGDLPLLQEPSVIWEGDVDDAGVARRLLRYNWTVEEGDRNWPRCNDQVMLMAYCQELPDPLSRACFSVSSARRSAGEDVLALPPDFAGRSVAVYISVISDDRKRVANSLYLGEIQI